jgi:adenylyltransferase/sulfurtransferase
VPPSSPAVTARLAAASVVVIGSGRLGSAAVAALRDAGVGSISVVDDAEGPRDPANQGSATASARSTERFEPGRTFELVLDADLLVDASETRATRYLANDAAAIRGIPLVWGSTAGGIGRVGVAWEERGVDYRDVEPEGSGDDDAPAGPAALSDVVGGMLATEALQLLGGFGDPLIGRVLSYDPLTGRTERSTYRRDPEAPRPGSLEERTAMPEDTPDNSVSPEQLAAELAGADAPRLIDVREPHEASYVSLPGSTLIPLAQLPDRVGELDPEESVVVYCHLGSRSARAVAFLDRMGFARARNLTGGIDAWARTIDSTLPRY